MQELQFSSAETSLFLKKSLMLSVDDEKASQIQKRLEGWPAGMRLLEQALKHSGTLDSLLAGFFYCLRGFEGYQVLDPEKVLSCTERAIDLIPEEYDYMRAFSFLMHSFALQMKGEFQRAVTLMQSALADEALQDYYTQGIIMHGFYKICLMENALAVSRTTAIKYQKICNKIGLRKMNYNRAQLDRACSQYQLNDLQGAKLDFRQGKLADAIGWVHNAKPRQIKMHYWFFLPEMTMAKILI